MSAAAISFRPRLRPRPRNTEFGLLIVASLTLLAGAVSLGATERYLAAQAKGVRLEALGFGPADPFGIGLYLGVLFAAHAVLILAGRRLDQVLLPAAGLLGGIGLLLMQRLPQNLVSEHLGSIELGLGRLQLLWLVVAVTVITALAVAVRGDRWLRSYKYTWAAAGIALLLLTFVFGSDTGGARLSLTVGPFSGQPSELLKVILVVFLAGYLSENRSLLAEESLRLGPLRFPPLPYLAPMGAMWAIALGIVIVQRDLGAALLFFAVFLALLYTATGRASYVGWGIVLFLVGSWALYSLFPHVRVRVDNWIDPFRDPSGAGFQAVQALYAFGRGGILGVGLGNGLPTIGGHMPVPAVHTDYPLAALGEELGLVGLLAILGLYVVVVQRGLRIAASLHDDFRALLAAGLSLVIGIQACIITAGDLKLIPLTGITLPFVSYGGSSLLANAIAVGLLLALSDRGPQPPPPPRRRLRLFRLGRPGRAARTAT